MAGLKRRWLLLMALAALLAGTVLGFYVGAPIGHGVSVVAESLARSVGWQTTARPEVLSMPRNEVTKDAPSTTQSLTGFDELSYAVYELVGGRRTNFQNVKTFPKNSLIRQLANGVGSLRITFKGQDESHACTAFVITDKPGATYALTAGHCFYQDGVCPTGRTTGSKTPPAIAEMYLVFNQFENTQLVQNDNTNPNAIPARLVEGELNCGNVDSTDKSKPYVDYAIVKLDDAKFQAHRSLSADNQIAPVSLGVVPIEPRHQLLILSQPDGRALMATERNCLATEHPDQPNGSFAHYCDTLKGSSGAPVFSRDHAVVAGLHTRSQYNPFAAGEENIAIAIETVVKASDLLRKLNILIKDPLTSEQQKLLDYSNKRAEESANYLNDSRSVLAAYLALDGLHTFLDGKRDDSVCLLQQSQSTQRSLTNALLLQRERLKVTPVDYSSTEGFSPDGTRVVTIFGYKIAHIWDARTGATLAVLKGHKQQILTAAFSPDGTRVLTSSQDGTARIWDARTGESLAVLKEQNWVLAATFSPDGTRVGTSSGERTARIWDARRGTSLAVLKGHNDKVLTVAFSPDGTRVLTTSKDGTARIWDARTGASLAELKGTHAVFSPDGTRAMTSTGEDKTIIWDGHNGKSLVVLGGTNATFNHDGTRVITVYGDFSVRISNGHTGESIAILKGHEKNVISAVFSHDGTRVLTTSSDLTARTWHALSGATIAVLSGHTGQIAAAAFSSDGTRVVTASRDKTARIWDARSGVTVAVLKGHEAELTSAAFSFDNTRVLTYSMDSSARIWDARAGSNVADLKGREGSIDEVAFSPDSTRVVTTSYDKTVHLWDTRTGASVAILQGTAPKFSSDSALVVTKLSKDKAAQIWDARTGARLAALKGHLDLVNSVAFSPDGTLVVTASDDKTARIWNARTGKSLAVLEGHESKVETANFSPDGARLVTISAAGKVRIWETRTGASIIILDGNQAAFSPDSTRLVTSYEFDAHVWDARTGASIAAFEVEFGADSIVFSPDSSNVMTSSNYSATSSLWDARNGANIAVVKGTHPAFSSDGTRVVTTASNNNTAQIWDARTGAQIAELQGHESIVNSAAFSPDNTRVLTVSYDNTARIWDAHTGEGIATLKGNESQINFASFSSDGTSVLTASNTTARMWDVLPTGICLLNEAARRLRSVSPSESERLVFKLKPFDPRMWLIPNCDADCLVNEARYRTQSSAERSRYDFSPFDLRALAIPECDDSKAIFPETRTVLDGGMTINELLAQPNSCRKLSEILNQRMKQREVSARDAKPEAR